MNKAFQQLYRQLVEEQIDTIQFVQELRSLADYRDDLLSAMNEQYRIQDWRNLSKLMQAVSLVADRSFTPLLCNLLNNYPHDGYMEAIADALKQRADETSVPCITRSLNYLVYGDDGRHFNRELINELYKIGTTEAIEGIKLAQSSSDELIKSHAEDFLAQLS